MSYKYNIEYTASGKKLTKNFKNKQSMISFLEGNSIKYNKLDIKYVNFSAIKLPYKHTIWYSRSS